MLSDALRGTRESPRASCASLLAPLVEEFGEDRVEIRMYHSPILTGWRKKFIPARLNEGWGLQHMKLYGIDDEVILSGYTFNYPPCLFICLYWTIVQTSLRTTSRTGRTGIICFRTRLSQIIMPEYNKPSVKSVTKFSRTKQASKVTN